MRGSATQDTPATVGEDGDMDTEDADMDGSCALDCEI